jgi:PAS domain S-box-containing protein
LYPQLKADEQAAAPTSTIGTPIEHLDFAALIKVLQALSGEIVLEKLIDTLMLTEIEQAGAERGLLILSRDGDLRIEAEATTSGNKIMVRLLQARMPEDAAPESVIRYVVRTGESVILDDASIRGPFSGDRYVHRRRARSVMCLPLVNQTKLTGLLYLENNLSPNVFTSVRIAALNLLASQAAISLENTRLYRDVQERKTYLAQAQRMSQTGNFWWRVSSGELVWSEELYRILGYDQTAIPSAELVFQRVHPEDYSIVKNMVDRVVREGFKADFEYRLLMPDESIKHLHIMLETMSGESEDREFIGTVMDITARKNAEEALQTAQTELAHVARITTLGELSASIAHEISQPLGAVVNHASACLRWLNAQNLEEARRSATMAVEKVHRAGEIISRIRALAAKTPPQKDWLDINLTIGEVVALAGSELQHNHVSLRTVLADDLPSVCGDRIQLQQVLLNLIINAVEAMSQTSEALREIKVSSQNMAEVAGVSYESARL